MGDAVDRNGGIVLALGENERALQHRLRVECQTLCIHFGCEAAGLDRLGEIGLQRFSMRSEEHTSELQSLMRISYAVFCLKKKKNKHEHLIYQELHKHLR